MILSQLNLFIFDKDISPCDDPPLIYPEDVSLNNNVELKFLTQIT